VTRSLTPQVAPHVEFDGDAAFDGGEHGCGETKKGPNHMHNRAGKDNRAAGIAARFRRLVPPWAKPCERSCRGHGAPAFSPAAMVAQA